jgi:PAS domain S-box-containing protein
VEQSADLAIILDGSGVMEYVNPAFEAITGYSQEEAIGQTLGMLKLEQPADELYEEMRNAVLEGHVFRGIVEERKKNGETCTVESALTPVRDAAGRVTHVICTGHDITDQRRMQSELQQSQKMDVIGRLAGGVAHDFNNLLLVISAYADLALDVIPEGDPVRRNLSEIITASRRAADLTRQLLVFGHKQAPVSQLLDLNTVLADIVGMLSRLIGEDIELIIAPGQNLGMIKADPIQIEQIVMNLAVNARDAMPSGGKLTIETSMVRLDVSHANLHSVVPPGDYVLLTVTDSGEGIASQHLTHIFEPFYTTKDADKGTGLGLATVHGIVNEIGGSVRVCSEPGLGAEFKIYIPRVHSSDCEMCPRSIEEGRPGGCETVLLVEDDSAVRESTGQFLTKCGYSVLPAGNGESGLRVSFEHSGQIALMICDVFLPCMSGPQLAWTLGMERPEMKALFVSGYAKKTVIQHGHIDLTANFLQKPFSLRRLAQKIREVLESSERCTMAASSHG